MNTSKNSIFVIVLCYLENCEIYSFPKDEEIRKAWLQEMRRITDAGEPWEPSNYHRLCSVHFRASDFQTRGSKSILKPDAVPIYFNIPKEVKNSCYISKIYFSFVTLFNAGQQKEKMKHYFI